MKIILKVFFCFFYFHLVVTMTQKKSSFLTFQHRIIYTLALYL